MTPGVPGVPGADGVRAARPGDARSIADVHVASWRAAYRGLLPDTYLAGLSTEARTSLWSEILADPSPGHVVVVELDGRIAGFAHVGPSGDDDAPPGTGELYTIYLHPDAWGRGHGRAMVEGALDRLRADGYRAVTLWMLSTNDRARRFYLREGWSAVAGVRTQQFGGQVVTDHRLGRVLAPPGRPQPRRRDPHGDPRAQIFSRPSQ